MLKKEIALPLAPHQDGQPIQLTGFIHEPGPYLPEQKWPAILFIPGGSLTHIEPDIATNVCLSFYNQGFNAFFMDYHFLTDQQPPLMPQPIIDLATGLDWLHTHAAEYYLDDQKIALMGFSIGGLLASLLADLPYKTDFIQRYHLENLQLASQALILGYPVTDLTAGWPHTAAELPPITNNPDDYQAMNWLTAQHCPTFVWNTATDGAVPADNSITYVAALQKLGVSVEYHLFHQGPHGMALADLRTARMNTHVDPHVAHWQTLVHEWLREVLAIQSPFNEAD
ncbi:alpha/beta hydrolase [Lapidilactobacillus wuchangensis]|uniref:alpha/beta hydrolase n=1 Tax=Lapidilactobacillus wuchangensis TaxID=2486001 RepID=UPI0013DE4C38|nr:alpha/beta hydrolase [Lapidilactobacillus wuchangensis]